jgi:hypothetical protein
MNRKYYKVETERGTVVRSTDHYFLAVVIVDGGNRGVFFCRDFRRADQVRTREYKFADNVRTVSMPHEISREEYDAIRTTQKVGA